MGKPADVLEVDGHATSEQVRELERLYVVITIYMLSVAWKATQSLVGLLVQPGDDSELPLAMTQLLITYHMLKATHT